MRIDGGLGDHAIGTFVPKVAGPPFVVLWLWNGSEKKPYFGIVLTFDSQELVCLTGPLF